VRWQRHYGWYERLRFNRTFNSSAGSTSSASAIFPMTSRRYSARSIFIYSDFS
jgi:hypothetical protein